MKKTIYHSTTSNRSQMGQELSQLQGELKPYNNGNKRKAHLSFQKIVKDHPANESKKCRARLNLDSIELVNEKTDKSDLARWFFFSFPREIQYTAIEL